VGVDREIDRAMSLGSAWGGGGVDGNGGVQVFMFAGGSNEFSRWFEKKRSLDVGVGRSK